MNGKTSEMDMLHGPLSGKLLLFTLPIALSSMVQQLFNAADTAVVGYFGSEGALAAVGTNTEIIALIVTLSSGLSIGANILIANRIGQNEIDELPAAVQTAMLLAALIGMAGLLLGQAAAAPLLELIQTPNSIFEEAALYLRFYMLSYPFLLLYDFGAAVLRARGDSRAPFLALMLSGVANVGLNLFFVVALHMGVAGVAIATDISAALSALLVLRRFKKDELFRLTFRKPQFSTKIAGNILKTGVPSAVQGAVFCFANIFVQASVNGFGETVIAGSTIAMNFTLSRHSVRRRPCSPARITPRGSMIGAGASCGCALAFRPCAARYRLLQSPVPRLFLVHFYAGGPVIERAAVRILCILLFEPLCNLYEIPAGVLRGSGHVLYPAVSTMLGICAFRIVWICTVFRTHPTLPMLYHAFPLSWAATILLVNLGSLLILRFRSR